MSTPPTLFRASAPLPLPLTLEYQCIKAEKINCVSWCTFSLWCDVWQMFMFPNQENGRFHVQEDGTLVVDSIKRSDAGEYSCHALSQAGSVETSMRIDVRGTVPHRLGLVCLTIVIVSIVVEKHRDVRTKKTLTTCFISDIKNMNNILKKTFSPTRHSQNRLGL